MDSTKLKLAISESLNMLIEDVKNVSLIDGLVFFRIGHTYHYGMCKKIEGRMYVYNVKLEDN